MKTEVLYVPSKVRESGDCDDCSDTNRTVCSLNWPPSVCRSVSDFRH